jgi:hypothetical protein
MAQGASICYRPSATPASAPGDAVARWQKTHAPRGKYAQEAYCDFLQGLEAIGAAEQVSGSVDFSNPRRRPGCIMPAPDIEHHWIPLQDRKQLLQLHKQMFEELHKGHEVPEKLSESEDWPFRCCGCCGTGDSGERLDALADWERFTQLRRYASVRRAWFLRLRRRVSQTADGESWDSMECITSNTLPKIRPNTFKLLVRQPEIDFDPIKWFLRLFGMATLLTSFISQSSMIQNLCPDAYMCPAAGLWPQRPVLAPPLHLRHNHSSSAPFVKTLRDYYHRLSSVCDYGAPACVDAGYIIEWPYIQSSASPALVAFAPALQQRGR